MSDDRWDVLLHNARIATMTGDGKPWGMIDKGALAVKGKLIAWLGADDELPGELQHLSRQLVDCHGKLVTPGLIDCHTHLVYGGDRAGEFEQRLNGVSYQDIARTGGGIAATVSATRAASEEDLYLNSLSRLQRLMADGVTTVEIKSGYGLTTEDELKQLRVARRLGHDNPVRVQTTFLGAHTLPPEYRDNSELYIDLVCNEMLPAVKAAGLADAVDGFCEHISFTAQQIKRVFTTAQNLDLPVKLHAEQLSNCGGAAMAAQHKALSVDHLEYLDTNTVPLLREHGTVAVLLPGAFYCLRETRQPPVQALRNHAVPMALATDCNPGSSPIVSLLLILNMACVLFGLTPEEALAGVTRNAARALGMADKTGVLAPGKYADFVLWRTENPVQLMYLMADLPCDRVWVAGRERRD